MIYVKDHSGNQVVDSSGNTVIVTPYNVACLGDGSNHGGTLVTSNQDGKYKVAGLVVCADQCQHSCPVAGHGTTVVTAATRKTRVNGRLVITTNATAACGAVIQPPDRGVYIE
jgi:uncharacterized Zn-binding protein involved in type VI secretion